MCTRKCSPPYVLQKGYENIQTRKNSTRLFIKMLSQVAVLNHVLRRSSITALRTYSRPILKPSGSPCTHLVHDLRVVRPDTLPSHCASVLVQQTRSKKRFKRNPKPKKTDEDSVSSSINPDT